MEESNRVEEMALNRKYNELLSVFSNEQDAFEFCRGLGRFLSLLCSDPRCSQTMVFKKNARMVGGFYLNVIVA